MAFQAGAMRQLGVDERWRGAGYGGQGGCGSVGGDGPIGTHVPGYGPVGTYLPARFLGPLGALLLAASATVLSGCATGFGQLDLMTVRRARSGFQEHFEKYPIGSQRRTEEVSTGRKKESAGSVFVAELIAIFPGFFVHGLGHYYAGDYATARQLRRLGEVGWIFSGVSAGLIVGGYYLDREDDEDDYQNIVYTLYGTGSFFGLVGVGYLLVAWFYDMIDTPRALESGGEPPPRSRFIESLSIFD